jgi:hypothetical protein
LSDFICIGSEKRGGESVHMAGPGSLEVIFPENNHATIKILESGRSPSSRHTDKTQRLDGPRLSDNSNENISDWFMWVQHLQAANILSKPFTNSEKWESTLRPSGYFITPRAAEGATEDKNLRGGTCTPLSVRDPAKRMGTCLPFSRSSQPSAC